MDIDELYYEFVMSLENHDKHYEFEIIRSSLLAGEVKNHVSLTCEKYIDGDCYLRKEILSAAIEEFLYDCTKQDFDTDKDNITVLKIIEGQILSKEEFKPEKTYELKMISHKYLLADEDSYKIFTDLFKWIMAIFEAEAEDYEPFELIAYEFSIEEYKKKLMID